MVKHGRLLLCVYLKYILVSDRLQVPNKKFFRGLSFTDDTYIYWGNTNQGA